MRGLRDVSLFFCALDVPIVVWYAIQQGYTGCPFVACLDAATYHSTLLSFFPVHVYVSVLCFFAVHTGGLHHRTTTPMNSH